MAFPTTASWQPRSDLSRHRRDTTKRAQPSGLRRFLPLVAVIVVAALDILAAILILGYLPDEPMVREEVMLTMDMLRSVVTAFR